MRRNREQVWQQFVSNRHRDELVKRTRSILTWISLSISLLGLALLITAMARPYYGKVSYREKINTRNILIAVDTSLSMLAKDTSPSRLDASKVIAINLINSLPEDRIGIMAYAGSSNVITSLTVDHPTIKEVVTLLDIDSAHIKGSDLSVAVRTGVKTLENAGKQANALIILSDGSTTLSDMSELLNLANKANIQIFCIGMGTEAGSPFYYRGKLHRARSGKVVISKLEKQVLQQLAIGTSGEYIDGTIRANDSISRAIKSMDQYELQGREQLIPKELYQWFLTPGLILLMLSSLLRSCGYRRLKLPFISSKTTSLAIIIASSTVTDSQAQDSWYESTTQQIFDKPDEIRKGYAALENKKYSTASEHLTNARTLSNGEQHAKLSLALAQAYYRSGDFANARTSYSDALISTDINIQLSARYNMSNSLFKQATQPFSPPSGMPFTNYLEAAIRGDKGVSKLSKGELDSIEKGLETTIHQYQETLHIESQHKAAHKNKLTAEDLLELIKDSRKKVQKQQEQENKQPKDKKEKGDQGKNEEENSGDNKGDKQDDIGKPKDSQKNGGNGEKGDPGELKTTDKSDGDKSSDQEMPRTKDDKNSDKNDPIKPGEITKFKSKKEALEFLKKNQDSKKKPLDRFGSRFWRKPPTVDW